MLVYSENNTETIIKNRILDNIPSDIDKLEGSFVYDVVSPASMELAQVYISEDDILKRTSPYTAFGTDLENITKAYGVIRKDGGRATTQIQINAATGTVLSEGTLVQTIQGLKYEITGDVTVSGTSILVEVQAVDIGEKYNVPANVITQMPVKVSGVTSVTNPNAVTNGYDVESDDSLRQRYFERLQTPATSGNKYHYKNWSKEVDGVGDAKVFSLWNGNGTVKIVIVNSNKRAADSNLISNVTSYIENNRPLGADVTVVSAEEKPIDIVATLVIDTKKYTLEAIQTEIGNNLSKYFKDNAFTNNYISYASIGNLIFNTQGVIDYSNLLINNDNLNISLEDEEVPVLGSLNLGV
jgi:uncharacterized phage protein gp47/JayE